MSAAAAVDALDVRERAYETVLNARKLFLANYSLRRPVDEESAKLSMAVRIEDSYAQVRDLPPPPRAQPPRKKRRTPTGEVAAPEDPALVSSSSGAPAARADAVTVEDVADKELGRLADGAAAGDMKSGVGGADAKGSGGRALVAYSGPPAHKAGAIGGGMIEKYTATQRLILKARARRAKKPKWRAPWKLMRVVAGHLGWVRSVAVDPTNEWFATGSADRTIKIWDLASGSLKLTLTGHINSVMGLAVSSRYPYLFSAGNDKMVKCWDLEQNKVVRHYHGHLSGVFCCAIHPTQDLLVTGSRDSTARVWDIRTKAEAFVLGGHRECVASLGVQGARPQIITGSMDHTVRLWDLVKGATRTTLTHHKKSVRALRIHPKEYTFASGAADNLKVWKCPDGDFMRNMTGHDAIINAMAINRDNVLVSGGDNGTLHFWDWKSAHCFQKIKVKPQPGSLDSECGIYAMEFDMTGSRLITCEADKSIKVWKEDETATPETHPLDWTPSSRPFMRY